MKVGVRINVEERNYFVVFHQGKPDSQLDQQMFEPLIPSALHLPLSLFELGNRWCYFLLSSEFVWQPRQLAEIRR